MHLGIEPLDSLVPTMASAFLQDLRGIPFGAGPKKKQKKWVHPFVTFASATEYVTASNRSKILKPSNAVP